MHLRSDYSKNITSGISENSISITIQSNTACRDDKTGVIKALHMKV